MSQGLFIWMQLNGFEYCDLILIKVINLQLNE